MKGFRNIVFLLVSILFSSCKDEYTICDLPKDVNLKSVFYQTTGGVERAATATSFSLKQLSAADFIYKDVPNVSQFIIPLNPLTDTVKFRISISSSMPADTITYIYTTQLVNLSPVCGDVYVNTITKVSTTYNTLDSIKISNRSVNTTPAENVKIYF